MKKHWPRGVHTIEKGWTHVATIEVQDSHDIAMHFNSRKLDVYVNVHKNRYGGVSIQYGPEEIEYSSDGCPYADDPIVSLEDGLRKTFGKVFNRCTLRHKKSDPITKLMFLEKWLDDLQAEGHSPFGLTWRNSFKLWWKEWMKENW